MPNTSSECDLSVVLSAVVVFGLPLALLIPNFSIWDIVPKIRVHRFHILSQYLTWMQINVAVIALVALLFCFYLEIRKRISVRHPQDNMCPYHPVGVIRSDRGKLKQEMGSCIFLITTENTCNKKTTAVDLLAKLVKLDDMVEEVLAVRHAMLATMEKEKERQEATMKACVELLDASADHYENLVLLHNEIRKCDKTIFQHPPITGPGSCSM